MLRKICTAAFFLEAIQYIDMAQILGPLRFVVRTAAQPMPEANMAPHGIVCKHKTPEKSFGVGLTHAGKRSLQHLKWSCGQPAPPPVKVPIPLEASLSWGIVSQVPGDGVSHRIHQSNKNSWCHHDSWKWQSTL